MLVFAAILVAPGLAAGQTPVFLHVTLEFDTQRTNVVFGPNLYRLFSDDAMRAPSPRAFSFAQATDSGISVLPAVEQKPQSLPNRTFCAPAALIQRPMRSATTSGCSMVTLE